MYSKKIKLLKFFYLSKTNCSFEQAFKRTVLRVHVPIPKTTFIWLGIICSLCVCGQFSKDDIQHNRTWTEAGLVIFSCGVVIQKILMDYLGVQIATVK